MDDALKTLMRKAAPSDLDIPGPDIKGMIRSAVSGESDMRAEFPAEPSAVQKLFTVLGRPGAMVRNVLAGNPELADKTGANWSSGRDVLSNIFGLPENKQEGFDLLEPFKDPKEFALDTAGFMAEVVTDPLSYFGFGTLTPAGQAAKRAAATGGKAMPSLWKQFQGDNPLRTAVGFSSTPTGPIQGSVSRGIDEAFGKAGEKLAGGGKLVVDKVIPDTAKNYMADTLRLAGVPGKSAYRTIERFFRNAEITQSNAWVAQIMRFQRNVDGQDVLGETGFTALRSVAENNRLLTDPNLSPQVSKAIFNMQDSLFGEIMDQSRSLGTQLYDYLDSPLAIDPGFAFKEVGDVKRYIPRMATNIKEKKYASLINDAFNPANIPTISENARRDTLGRGILGGANTVNDIFMMADSIDPDGMLKSLWQVAKGNPQAAQEFKSLLRERTRGKIFDNIQFRDQYQRLRFVDVTDGSLVNKWDGELESILKGIEDRKNGFGKAQALDVRLSEDGKSIRFRFSGKVGDDEIDKLMGYRKITKEAKKQGKDLGAVIRGEVPLTIDGNDLSIAQTGREIRTLQYTKDDGSTGMMLGLVDTTKTRTDSIAEMMLHPDNLKAVEEGVFPNSLMQDAYEYVQAKSTRNAAVRAMYRAMGTAVKAGDLGDDGLTVFDLVSRMKVIPGVAYKNVFRESFGDDALRMLGDLKTGNVSDARKVLGRIYDGVDGMSNDQVERLMSKKTMDHLEKWSKDVRFSRGITQDIELTSPGLVANNIGWFSRTVGDYGRLWKAATLAWPSRHVRDLTSNMVRNIEAGFVDDPVTGAKLYKRVHDIYLGRGDKNLRNIEALKDMVAEIGLDPATAPDEEFTKAFKQLFAELKGNDLSIREELSGRPGRGVIPGYSEPTSGLQFAKDVVAGKTGGRERTLESGLSTLFKNPSSTDIPGLGHVLRASDAVGDYTDSVGRMQAFLAQIEKGIDPTEAMNRLQDALINYDPRRLEPFERYQLKQWMPFYNFWRGNTAWVAGQLLHRPGGRVSQLMKIYQNTESQTDPMIPDWMRETVAVPYFSESGAKVFVTGFGMMTEDAISTLGGVAQMFESPGQGSRTLMLEAANRVNPVPKSLYEWATGVSTFQADEEGGRRLAEMDPPIGRLASNISERFGTGAIDSPVGVMPLGVEHMVNALPGVPRLLRAANKILDTRPSVTPGQKALNTLTGMKITTIDEAQQAKYGIDTLREMLQEFKPVTYDLPLTLVNMDRLERLPPEEQEKILRMRQLLEELQQKRKSLRKAE